MTLLPLPIDDEALPEPDYEDDPAFYDRFADLFGALPPAPAAQPLA